jgi:hypothetical protein
MFLQKFSDEVVVSSLPHPISMFLMGITIVITAFLFMDYKRVKEEFKLNKETIKDLENKLDLVCKRTDDKLADISRKIDSRGDKAIMSIKTEKY